MRPGRGTRPRSKVRPRHLDASGGLVVAVDRGRYTCLVDRTPVTAMLARELGRTGVVVGDHVALVGELAGGPDALARIVRIEPRRSVLRRTADDTDPVERVIVANADQLAIVASVAQPEPRPRLIDRCLVAAYDAGLDPLLVVTKADLADPAPLLAAYVGIGAPSVVSGHGDDGRGLASLRRRLRERVTVLVGHSGVGKSTLVNAMIPDAARATGAVNAVTGRGRHVSTSAVALPLPDGGWVIDTPGVRSFGLAHVDVRRALHAFPDLEPGAADCPSDCDHVDPTVCELDEWVAAGRAEPARLESLRRLLVALRGGEPD